MQVFAKDIHPGDFIYMNGGFRRVGSIKKFPTLISMDLAGWGTELFNPNDEVFRYEEDVVDATEVETNDIPQIPTTKKICGWTKPRDVT